MAAWHGHREAVQLLISHGADVSAINKVSYLFLIFFFFISTGNLLKCFSKLLHVYINYNFSKFSKEYILYKRYFQIQNE